MVLALCTLQLRLRPSCNPDYHFVVYRLSTVPMQTQPSVKLFMKFQSELYFMTGSLQCLT
jgi:hypothetical protein